MRRVVSVILLCAFIASSLTACWDARELDDWAYAISIGVDKGVDNVLRFTFWIPSFKQEGGTGAGSAVDGKTDGAGGQSGGQKHYSAISIDAPTFYTGTDMIETSLSRKLSYMHVKYLVIGEELAREGVERFINGMVRSRQIRRTMHIIIAKGKASEFLENFNPFFAGAVPKAEEGFMNQKDETGFFEDTSYQIFMRDMKSGYRMPAAPLASINDFSNYKESGDPPPLEEFTAGGKYTAGEVPRNGGNNFEFFGTALFDGDKMVGELNGIETRMLLMVRNELTRASISMQDPLNKRLRISIDAMLEKKTEVKVELGGGKPVINVKLFLEGDLQNNQSSINYESVEMKPVLENAFKKGIKSHLQETIDICQRLNVDVFGFGEKAAPHFLTIQEWERYNWLSHFKEAQINTEVEFTIRRTGTMLETNPTRTSQGEKK